MNLEKIFTFFVISIIVFLYVTYALQAIEGFLLLKRRKGSMRGNIIRMILFGLVSLFPLTVVFTRGQSFNAFMYTAVFAYGLVLITPVASFFSVLLDLKIALHTENKRQKYILYFRILIHSLVFGLPLSFIILSSI